MTNVMDLAGFIGRVTSVQLAVKAAETRALDKAARIVKAEAKREVGRYQGAIGPLVAWAELADATKEDRLRQGFTPNDPLWRTGGLRESIRHVVRDGVAIVGSNDDKAVWQELGTEHIPPRSFLAGSLLRKMPEVQKAMAGEVVVALVGAAVAPGLLGLPAPIPD